MPLQKRYLLGVDLAKAMDFSTFAVIEMIWDPEIKNYRYHLRGLDKIQGVDYPKITDMIITTFKQLQEENKKEIREGGVPVSDGPYVCMDASGLGAPIRDFLLESGVFSGGKFGEKLFPVVFTGGESARRDPDTNNYNISKALIIGNFGNLMQRGRFDYASDLQALPQLEKEIDSFKYYLTPSGHTGFSAESGQHDDLICSICIPLIIGEWQYNRSVARR